MNEMRKLLEALDALEGNNSCVGCKFLYAHDEGYSSYTVMNISIDCALDRNKNLPGDRPDDWGTRNQGDLFPQSPEIDNWPATQDSRCERYAVDRTGGEVHLDVDGEEGPANFTSDKEAIAAICAATGRKPHGGYQG